MVSANSPSPASAVLLDPLLLQRILAHLYADLLDLGRERRQADFSELALVHKTWKDPVNRRLYMNPFLGCKRRAGSLQACLEDNPENGRYVLKWIFGEGSDMDIRDWPTPHTPANLILAAPNVECIGFDGLSGIHLQAFGKALTSAKKLVELRACDRMPEPWCFINYLFDQVIEQAGQLHTFRLYGLHTEDSTLTGNEKASSDRAFQLAPLPRPLHREFVNATFNHCTVSGREYLRIFHSSVESLRSLSFENPTDMTGHDILLLLRHAGKNLEVLEIIGFLDGEEDKMEVENGNVDHSSDASLICDILDCCPKLKTLDFFQGVASRECPAKIVGSNLESWRFTSADEFTPDDWINAFQDPKFPKNARCRVRTPGRWSESKQRRVRIAAWQSAGLSWLEADEDAPLDLDADDFW